MLCYPNDNFSIIFKDSDKTADIEMKNTKVSGKNLGVNYQFFNLTTNIFAQVSTD